MELIRYAMELLTNIGISVFSFVFIMMYASWPINDKAVPWYYPVIGFLAWLLLMCWVWEW